MGAGPRHVEILSTPGVRTSDEDDGKEFDAEGRACYRSWTMRASYLAQVRSEGTCETDATAEHQEHASAQTSGAIQGKSKVLGRLW